MKYLLPLLLLFSCGPQAPLEEPPLAYTFLVDSAQSHPDIRGVWQSIGNGYYLEVRPDSLWLYSYTRSFCYKEKNDYLEGLLRGQSQFTLRGDTLALYLTDYGEATRQLQAKKDFVRVKSLPEGWLSFAEMTRLSPEKQLALYQETLQENYAFAEERGMKWDEVFLRYQDSLLFEKTSLFEAMGAIATLTKDHHTKVIDSTGRRLQYTVTPSALDVQHDFEQQNEITDLNAYFGHFFQTNQAHIADSLLHGQGKKVANGQLQYGLINDKVGYLQISAFAGFLNNTFTRRQQIDSLRHYMREIIESFAGTEGLIVDISFNFGGYDGATLALASYFAQEATLAYTSEVFQNGDFYVEDEVWVYPAKEAYTKPIYVLMTDISRSAAENFAMMMDAQPHATLAGTRTLGILSGMLGKSISDFYVTCSHQRLVNPEGEYFEAKGVQPDREITVFPRGKVMRGHLEAVRELGRLLEP
ncbi:MAG: S41 family peptidase [Bacteroidota bacterium]